VRAAPVGMQTRQDNRACPFVFADAVWLTDTNTDRELTSIGVECSKFPNRDVFGSLGRIKTLGR
jgi:hypothetical protein